ncbi:NADH dehydrogenase I subunit NdhO [Synechococcus sp. RS9909]|nr:hypothetical protein RS9917_07275 [Synechococcus sp. RS9917]QNI80510.1 NADH dehydrogenase I subunit NdhO [Synechococcus sp. RS9909]
MQHRDRFSLLFSECSVMAETAPALKKGALVRVNRQAYSGSVEAAASDPSAPAYIFEGPGELLAIQGDYGQVRWRRPVPDVWLKLAQLETCD